MVRGWEVLHILPDGQLGTHALPDFASVRDDHLIYDGGQSGLMLHK
jgi:hypothetical protein